MAILLPGSPTEQKTAAQGPPFPPGPEHRAPALLGMMGRPAKASSRSAGIIKPVFRKWIWPRVLAASFLGVMLDPFHSQTGLFFAEKPGRSCPSALQMLISGPSQVEKRAPLFEIILGFSCLPNELLGTWATLPATSLAHDWKTLG